MGPLARFPKTAFRQDRMTNITLILEPDEEAQLRAAAKSFGLSLSGYVRTLVRDSFKRDMKSSEDKLLNATRALVPVLAEALCRTLGKTPEQMEKLTQVILERYEKEQ